MTGWKCPELSCWHDFLEGVLPGAEAARLGQHLNDCPACQRTMDALTEGTGPWLDGAKEPARQAGPALRRVMAELKDEPDRIAVSAPSLDFLDPPAKAGQLGVLGRYEVLEVIGHGGMGVVLKASDPALNRFVAIKVLAPQWASSGSARMRFAREARATAAVRHDHVVAVHGVDEVKGLPYLVMEYVHGTSLQARIERTGPLEVSEVLRIGVQTAAGLEAAHAQGLVHRDVKPSNILLENGVERVKLSDFGLARAVDDASLTQSGVIAGTPQYMSPEQANGEAIDHRSDLFSLGSTLYAACTGRPPFRAPGTVAVLRRVCEDEPRPIREVNPDVPQWLEQIIARLHAKRPADRFQSAGEVAALLRRCLADRQRAGHIAQPAFRKEASQRPHLALGLALGGVVALLVVPCLLLALMLGLVASLLTPTPPAPPVLAPPVVVERLDPHVDLANGKVERDKDGILRFQVDYELRPGSPDATLSYVWVVRSGEKTLYEQAIEARDLAAEGTLRGQRPAPRIAEAGPLETYLECKHLVPGKIGWQRERISDAVKLAE